MSNYTATIGARGGVSELLVASNLNGLGLTLPAPFAKAADALIRARKRFDMTVIPGADHGLGNSYYVNLIRYYFTEHLLGLPQQEIDIVKHN